MSIFTKFVKRGTAALSPTDRYRLRQQKKRVRGQAQQGDLPTLDQIADADNLIRVLRELRQKGGQAPGIDGVTYDDLSPPEIGTCMRALSQVVQCGLYRPAPSVLVEVPKASGNGHRTLAIRTIMDRVISAALNNALMPFWDKRFVPNSMGFRPRKSPWDMLIALERAMVQQEWWVMTIDDIRDAFDHVNLNDLMADHYRHIGDKALLNLIEIILRGGTNPSRKVGIEQGNAYSPTALNIRLHHVHDLAINPGDELPSCWFRYADNLVYLTKDVSEGVQTLRQSQTLLQSAGFTLKGEDGPSVNLKEERAHLLGFQISFDNGQVVYRLGEDAWKGLRSSLDKAHEALNPPVYARSAVRGWINAYGPAFESTYGAEVERVLQLSMVSGNWPLLKNYGRNGSRPTGDGKRVVRPLTCLPDYGTGEGISVERPYT
jgi:retron-type reverse transcriptase